MSAAQDTDKKKWFITGNFAVASINKCLEDIQAISSPHASRQIAPESIQHFSAEVAKLNFILNSNGGNELDDTTKYAYAETAVDAINNFAAKDSKELVTLADQQIHDNVKKYKSSLQAVFASETTQQTWYTALHEAKKHAIPFAPAQG